MKFAQTKNNKKYKILFKKNDWFTQTDLDNASTIQYSLNGVKVSTPEWIDGTADCKIQINDLQKNDIITLQWLTDDSVDGGALTTISDISVVSS